MIHVWRADSTSCGKTLKKVAKAKIDPGIQKHIRNSKTMELPFPFIFLKARSLSEEKESALQQQNDFGSES